MHDPEIDQELQLTAQRVADLSKRVEINLRHKARLRDELSRRHQELSAETAQRAAGTLWPRFPRFKRLTLVAPAALAAATALSALIWLLPIVGHQSPRPAEAERIASALAESVPTVTRWNVTVQQESDDSTFTFRCKYGPVQRLYIRDGQAYLYSTGRWYRITAVRSRALCASDLQWAFAIMTTQLDQRELIGQGTVVDGQATDEFRSVSVRPNRLQIVSAFWVNRQNGLIVRLQRVTRRAGKVLERESADYRYNYQRAP